LGFGLPRFFPFDLNNDSKDEIYFVNNVDTVQLLRYDYLRLEFWDRRTGKQLGRWLWKRTVRCSNSHTFSNFIFGSYSKGDSILIRAKARIVEWACKPGTRE
jgi:hypothetical protein